MKAIEEAMHADEGSPAVRPRLLGVGSDSGLFQDLARYARAEGEALDRVPDAPAALRAIARGGWSVVIVVLDQEPDDQLGWWVDVLRRVPKRPRLVVLVPSPSIGFVLRAWQMGVFDVLPVPLSRDRFAEMLHRACAAEDETAIPLPDLHQATVGPTQMVSGSPSMLPVFRTMAQVSPSTATVLIQGESGTGKELVARAIHLQGPRAAKPFVAINCAAIPENLLESELFGHEKGAFTGAVARKIGRFERATGGTLFLDEIGDMSLVLQSKILRAVQEREIERVGGTEPITVDVRMIAATHRDLKSLIAEGRFREDLYYRLAVVTIELPRLSERDNDLLLLSASFLQEFGVRYGKTFTGITEQALTLLRQHDWAGNIRELRNVIERAVLVAESDVLRSEHLPESWRTRTEVTAEAGPESFTTLSEMEARHIARTLDHTHGHVGECARLLGVHRNTLARKIKEYGL
ncbi:MAG: sigma 54-interacting transcriptional regulator [Gemmatimonadaceae bacterium]